jgi:hypothetical protein
MGGSPTSAVKRAANAERDIAISDARFATVQARAGSRWIKVIARPICRSRSAPSQPVRASGSCSIHVGQAGDNSLATRPRLASFGGHEAQRAQNPVHLRGTLRLDVYQLRQTVDQVTRGRFVKAHYAADERRRRATAFLPQQLVVLAEIGARKIEQTYAGHARLARQPVALAVRHEREITGLQQMRLNAINLQPAAAGDRHVEHQQIRQLGQL